MFNINIIPKTQVNYTAQNKVTGDGQPQNNNNTTKTTNSENKDLTIEHNISAQPLTDEEQSIKDHARKSELDEISAMKAQTQKTGSQNTLPKTITFTREDGIKIELTDNYDGSVSEQNDYSEIPTGNIQIKLTITDKNNNKHELLVELSFIEDRDIFDLRTMKNIIGKYIANLPEETINKLTETTSISFSNEEDEYIDTSGGDTLICSPTFELPKRTYKPQSNFTRNDGCKFEIKDQNETSSTLTITTPDEQVINFKLESNDTDKFHQWQLPKFQKMLNEIPLEVLKEMPNEIDTIRFLDHTGGLNGIYPLGSGTIGLYLDFNSNTRPITFIHELGHAIDNQNGTMKSKSPEFANKFEEFKAQVRKLGINEYSLTNPEEFFASTYAYLSIDENGEENHILNIEKQLEKLKNSNNPDAEHCYELLQDLKSDVQNIITSTKSQTPETRFNTKVRDLIRQECQDIIREMDNYYCVSNFIGQSTELELIHVLSLEDNDFENAIKGYEERSQSDRGFAEVNAGFAKMAAKLRELRTRL